MKNTIAADKVIEYVLGTERENYESFCEENGLAPECITGRQQKTHVYALALLAKGLKY